MAFRQNNKEPQAVWRKKCRDELLANGIPASVIDDERRWNYVLLHATDEFGSGWDPSWITKEQAGNLLTLLRTKYTNPVGLDLIMALGKRINAASIP